MKKEFYFENEDDVIIEEDNNENTPPTENGENENTDPDTNIDEGEEIPIPDDENIVEEEPDDNENFIEEIPDQPIEKRLTPFFEVYNRFLHGVTDDMYISWTQEETYEDLETFLVNAVVQFRYCKQPIRNYSLKYKQFMTELTPDEVYILSLLMTIEWIGRQMTTVRLTELQYTGSDAKVLNTKSQMNALISLKENIKKDLEKQLMDYQYHEIDEEGYYKPVELSLSGKGVTGLELLQTIRETRRI